MSNNKLFHSRLGIPMQVDFTCT